MAIIPGKICRLLPLYWQSRDLVPLSERGKISK
jgi:hypothetical protein